MSDIDVILKRLDTDREMDVLLSGFDVIDTKSGEATVHLTEPLAWAEKLVYHAAINKRNDCRYLSVRRWRTITKQQDIRLLKQAKRDGDERLSAVIAKDISDMIMQLVRDASMFYVTSPPRGASHGPAGWHLATEAGKAVADILGIEFKTVFADRIRTGGSHPKSYDRRGSLELIGELPAQPCLLIDDLATTGCTLECCSEVLGKHGVVLSVAWLHADSAEVDGLA